MAGQYQLYLAHLVRPLVDECHCRAQANITVWHSLWLMQFRALYLFEQHRSDDGLPVLGAQGQPGDHVGLCGKQVDWGPQGRRMR